MTGESWETLGIKFIIIYKEISIPENFPVVESSLLSISTDRGVYTKLSSDDHELTEGAFGTG